MEISDLHRFRLAYVMKNNFKLEIYTSSKIFLLNFNFLFFENRIQAKLGSWKGIRSKSMLIFELCVLVLICTDQILVWHSIPIKRSKCIYHIIGPISNCRYGSGVTTLIQYTYIYFFENSSMQPFINHSFMTTQHRWYHYNIVQWLVSQI